MHYRDDLDCTLLEEARERNPTIATYALSWCMPA